MSETQENTLKQIRTGMVTSAAGDKTIHVAVDTRVRHPQYGKYMRRRSKFAVHDEQNVANVGDLVEIVPCRRVSKSKSWRLIRVVREATIATRAAAEKG